MDAGIVHVETVCSDPAEHRRRIETRATDVEGLVKPSWEQVVGREYDTWTLPHLAIDTARMPVSDAVQLVAAEMEAARRRGGE